jgi:hypothetical protein
MPTGNSPLYTCRVITLIRSSTHIYHTIPLFEKLGNNILLLLTYSTIVSDYQLDVLRE